MELFSEIYGAYYAAVADVLRAAPLTRAGLRRVLNGSLSPDGAAEVEEKLISGEWPFLRERGGKYHSVLAHPPVQSLSALERAYLRSLIDDPRTALFLSDAQLECAKEKLGDTPNLFRADDFIYYDRFSDGDALGDTYRDSFRVILSALKNEDWLEFEYTTRRGKQLRELCRPLTLEYSGKDARFRLHSADIAGRYTVHNIAAISNARIVETPELYSPAAEILTPPMCDEPVTVEVSAERSALARFMPEFSYLKKTCALNEENGTAVVRLWYPKADETEIVIRLLSFGPVIRVVSPESIVDQLRARVQAQSNLPNQ